MTIAPAANFISSSHFIFSISSKTFKGDRQCVTYLTSNSPFDVRIEVYYVHNVKPYFCISVVIGRVSELLFNNTFFVVLCILFCVII